MSMSNNLTLHSVLALKFKNDFICMLWAEKKHQCKLKQHWFKRLQSLSFQAKTKDKIVSVAISINTIFKRNVSLINKNQQCRIKNLQSTAMVLRHLFFMTSRCLQLLTHCMDFLELLYSQCYSLNTIIKRAIRHQNIASWIFITLVSLTL